MVPRRWPDSCDRYRIVVRSAHRTRLAKFFAVCLLAFAVSPVTAPFTTCDLSDFTHPHQTDTGHHPGRQMAEAHVKIAPHLVTITFELRPAPSVHAAERRHAIVDAGAPAPSRRDRLTALRL
jgi:hypothetical protein